MVFRKLQFQKKMTPTQNTDNLTFANLAAGIQQGFPPTTLNTKS